MFTLPDLPYSYEALEPFIDTETMHLHHDKHHATYVKNLNDVLEGKDELMNMSIDELIKNLNKVDDTIRMKVRNNGGGHINHSFFWKVMGPPAEGAGGEPGGKLMELIKSSFGDFTKFQDEFTKAGIGRFGSGWVWLIAGGNKLTIKDSPNQDSPWMEAVPAGRQGKTPILCIDVWEHAYYLKYQNRRADYIKAFWNVINWRQVSENFEKVR